MVKHKTHLNYEPLKVSGRRIRETQGLYKVVLTGSRYLAGLFIAFMSPTFLSMRSGTLVREEMPEMRKKRNAMCHIQFVVFALGSLVKIQRRLRESTKYL